MVLHFGIPIMSILVNKSYVCLPHFVLCSCLFVEFWKLGGKQIHHHALIPGGFLWKRVERMVESALIQMGSAQGLTVGARYFF